MEKIEFIPEPPAGLKQAALRGVIVPFIGAGASKIGGCPNWAEFADSALRFFVPHSKFTHGQIEQLKGLPPKAKLTLAKSLARQHDLPVEYPKILECRDPTLIANGRKLYGALWMH